MSYIPTKTHTVRGNKIRVRTPRQFIVVAVRPESVETPRGTYVPFAHVEKRTDNIDTARQTARRYGRAFGAFAVIINNETGEEV